METNKVIITNKVAIFFASLIAFLIRVIACLWRNDMFENRWLVLCFQLINCGLLMWLIFHLYYNNS